MWGTILPLVSGMFGGMRVVSTSYYERAAGPLLAAILALMAAGPLLPWRRAGSPTLRALRWPVAATAIVALGLLAFGVRSLPGLIALPLAAGAGTTVLTEYGRAMRKRPDLLVRKRRR